MDDTPRRKPNVAKGNFELIRFYNRTSDEMKELIFWLVLLVAGACFVGFMYILPTAYPQPPVCECKGCEGICKCQDQ